MEKIHQVVKTKAHLLGGLISQLGGDVSERFPIGSSLLTGSQDGAVRLAGPDDDFLSVGAHRDVFGTNRSL